MRGDSSDAPSYVPHPPRGLVQTAILSDRGPLGIHQVCNDERDVIEKSSVPLRKLILPQELDEIFFVSLSSAAPRLTGILRHGGGGKPEPCLLQDAWGPRVRGRCQLISQQESQ